MRCLLVTLLLSAALNAKWCVQFFHDQDDSSLAFVDLKLTSSTRGLAVGVRTARGSRPRGVALLTRDGGTSWTEVPLPDLPLALFALDEQNVWLVGRDAVWKSVEFGRAWTRTAKLKGVLRVHFLDEQRGFAAGRGKSAWRTSDAGKTWSLLPEAAQPDSSAQDTAYSQIAFWDSRLGFIAGTEQAPPAEDAVEPWLNGRPSFARAGGTRVLLQTRDGGATWTPSTVNKYGSVRRLTFGAGRGLSLIDSGNADHATEVHRITFRESNLIVFRRKDRSVTDVAVDRAGAGLLAAIERPGKLLQLPIPGRLRIYESLDLVRWVEMEVDYRAVANSAVLAIGGPQARFAATDTGMILKYEAPAIK